MRLRTLRSWIVLAGLAAICCAAVSPSRAVEVLAGATCLACATSLVLLDGLRKRSRR